MGRFCVDSVSTLPARRAPDLPCDRLGALFDHSLGVGGGALLVASIVVALGFEFVNGFHDTANAVATVIYTNALRPLPAVILSGICNFSGVFLGGIAVAMGIVHLLPVELLVQTSPSAGLAMVLALLVGALLWNLGTWYLGLPASSSHTLIGAILGVGLASSTLAGHTFGDGVNWTKAIEVGLSLLLSPVVGLVGSYLVYILGRRYAKNRGLVAPPKGSEPPPPGTRALLVATSAGVSFAHGSNDGQKGVGLIMLILVGLVPAGFALDASLGSDDVAAAVSALARIDETLVEHGDRAGATAIEAARARVASLRDRLERASSTESVAPDQRFATRVDVLMLEDQLRSALDDGHLGLSAAERERFDHDRGTVRALTEYAPVWVLIAVALALGVGTTVGWKRIVVTVGEKIGKTHLNYGQGASAQFVATISIGLSSWFGLPVSTTHVLSSGVAGTMTAESGLQLGTIRKIAAAWVLTLPAAMVLSGGLYRLFLLFV